MRQKILITRKRFIELKAALRKIITEIRTLYFIAVKDEVDQSAVKQVGIIMTNDKAKIIEEHDTCFHLKYAS